MPPNGEKQSQWLMSCKCGARVKASAEAAGMTRYSARSDAMGPISPSFTVLGRSKRAAMNGEPGPEAIRAEPVRN
jgi:hypothetical protein